MPSLISCSEVNLGIFYCHPEMLHWGIHIGSSEATLSHVGSVWTAADMGHERSPIYFSQAPGAGLRCLACARHPRERTGGIATAFGTSTKAGIKAAGHPYFTQEESEAH